MLHNNLIKLLTELHGEKIDITNGEVFVVYMDGAVFTLYLDEEEKTVKFDIEMMPEKEKVFVYNTDIKFEDFY